MGKKTEPTYDGTRCLDIHDLLEVMDELRLPGREKIVAQIEALADQAAQLIADTCGIKAGPASWEGEAFGGLCASFFGVDDKQPCPQAISIHDEGGSWETTEKIPPISVELRSLLQTAYDLAKDKSRCWLLQVYEALEKVELPQDAAVKKELFNLMIQRSSWEEVGKVLK